MPLFSPADLVAVRPPASVGGDCGKCGLYRGCRSPKMPYHGQGRRKILVVGEAPGKDEDYSGRPFVGQAGKFLREALEDLGADLDRDCWTTNAARCRPPANKLPDRAILHCRPFLIREVRELNPEVIIPLGTQAVKSLLGWLWKEDVGTISRWAGFRIPHQGLNCWICPTFHPSFVMRADHEFSDAGSNLRKLFFRRHLEAALGLSARPWGVRPDYRSRLRVVLDPAESAGMVERMAASDTPVAVDYENDRLKPDREDAEIVSCAVSDGTTSISYPWVGEAVEATKKLLFSEVPKIASNAKHEERWTLREFGRPVKNWWWDTMLAAHLIDNRPGVCSIKFLAFALLGQDPWDRAVKPYLKADHPNDKNRVRELPLPTLLRYGAMDALMEWEVAMIQRRELGYD